MIPRYFDPKEYKQDPTIGKARAGLKLVAVVHFKEDALGFAKGERFYPDSARCAFRHWLRRNGNKFTVYNVNYEPPYGGLTDKVAVFA